MLDVWVFLYLCVCPHVAKCLQVIMVHRSSGQGQYPMSHLPVGCSCSFVWASRLWSVGL